MFVFDFVQFLYTFFFTPLLFVWAKTFLRYIVANELQLDLSDTALFVIDTVYSVFALYIFAFVVIHSLTKTFNLKKHKDPLYDFFEHSEYLHLWLSHIVIYVGASILVLVFGLINIFIPIEIDITRTVLHLVTVVGAMSGIVVFSSAWLSDPREKQKGNFMRLIKLVFGMSFSLLVLCYYVFDPSYSSEHSIFWWVFMLFAAATAVSFFSYRSQRAHNAIDRFLDNFKHNEWDFQVKKWWEFIKKERMSV